MSHPESTPAQDFVREVGHHSYSTILADPPWQFTNRTGKMAPEHRRLTRYTTLTFQAIKDLPVAVVAAAQSHLYLWVPNALLREGLEVMEAWGFCLGVGTRILTADLRWVRAEELEIGSKLIGFDEERQGTGSRRYFRFATVLSTGIEQLPSYEITLGDGTVLIASRDHQWLMRTSQNGEESVLRWIRTGDIDSHLTWHTRKYALQMSRLLSVVMPEHSYEAGFLSAAFDAEGSLYVPKTRLMFSQNVNALWHQVRDYLRALGFTYAVYDYEYQTTKYLYLTSRDTVFRFLMMMRPPRLLSTLEMSHLQKMSLYNLDYVDIVKVRSIGLYPCVTLMTDTGTYIAEGFGAHNTYKTNLVWHKVRKDGGPDGRGVGFYFRNTTEMVLFGVRGRLRTLAPGRTQVNVIKTRKREHSRKPDELYDLIEACSPGPFLELFARGQRAGWEQWGHEVVDYAPSWPTYAHHSQQNVFP